MKNIYYKGELIPIGEWDFHYRRPRPKLEKPKSKAKAKVEEETVEELEKPLEADLEA
jgi:hypothetical protein